MSAGRPWTVATYNIRRGVGMDGVADPERILRVLSDLNADAFALQEVDSGDGGDRGMLQDLARELGKVAVAGVTLRRPGTHYGNGVLLSRRPDRVARHDLSLPGREPRGALEVAIGGDGGETTLVCTHLGLGRRERVHQISTLLRRIRALRSSNIVVAGDMNEWLRFGGIGDTLRKAFGPSPAPKTFPSRWPLFALDRIWAIPPASLTEVRAVSNPLTRAASDHLPLVATVEPSGASPSS